MSGFGNAPVWPSKEKEGWEFGFAKSYEWRDSAKNLSIANSCSMSSSQQAPRKKQSYFAALATFARPPCCSSHASRQVCTMDGGRHWRPPSLRTEKNDTFLLRLQVVFDWKIFVRRQRWVFFGRWSRFNRSQCRSSYATKCLTNVGDVEEVQVERPKRTTRKLALQR